MKVGEKGNMISKGKRKTFQKERKTFSKNYLGLIAYFAFFN